MKKPAKYSLIPFFALLQILYCTSLFASDTTKTWSSLVKDFSKKELKVEWISQPPDSNNVKEFEIIDVRPDSTHLGMFSTNGYLSKSTILNFRDGFSLEQVLKTKLLKKSDTGTEVLMIIKDFWMTDVKTKRIENNELGRQEFQTSKVVFHLDLFVKQEEQYYPLIRIDTVIWSNKNISTSADKLVESALVVINEKIIIAFQSSSYQNRTAQTRQTILTNYNKYDPLKIIKENTPQKGIYYTYDQFKKNRPTTENFKINIDKYQLATLFLVNNKGEETYKRDIWGLYDGSNFYIMQDGMLFRLYQEGKAFYWLGLKEYDQRSIVAPAAVPLGGGWAAVGFEKVGSTVKVKLSPKLLDINTGKEY